MTATLTMLALITLAQAAPPAPTPVDDAVLAADAARIHAFTTSDPASLDTLLADDLTYTHSSGVTDTKTQIVGAITSGRTQYHTIVPSDVRVRVYGDVAVLTGRASVNVTNNGQVLDLNLRFTSVYVKRNGHWQFAAWQSTKVAQ